MSAHGETMARLAVPQARSVQVPQAQVRDLIWEDSSRQPTEPLRAAARSVSVGHSQRMGGDAWSIATRDGDMLLLVADARGNGEAAAPLARAVLTVFRTVTKHSAQWDLDRLIAVLRDTISRAAAGDEDFMTALVVRASAQGELTVASCGHPAPLVLSPRGVREVSVQPALPLGLGSDGVVPTHDQLAPDERLLLFTDGLTEAADPQGQSFAVEQHADALLWDDLEVSLDALLGRVMRHTHGLIHDDLTMLLVAGPPHR